MDDTKALVIRQIKEQISNRIGTSASSLYSEIIHDLAYACTFRNPRPFATIEMNDQRWFELAETITIAELANVRASLSRFKPGGNRLFYILGGLARMYGQRKTCSDRKPNFKQHHYTNAELASHVTSIDRLIDAAGHWDL